MPLPTSARWALAPARRVGQLDQPRRGARARADAEDAAAAELGELVLVVDDDRDLGGAAALAELLGGLVDGVGEQPAG